MLRPKYYFEKYRSAPGWAIAKQAKHIAKGIQKYVINGIKTTK